MPGPASASTSRAAAIRTTARSCLPIDSLEGLISLVQASVLEIHVWGARLADIEQPDGITFDLDPAPEVAWADVVAAAFEVRDRLERARPRNRS